MTPHRNAPTEPGNANCPRCGTALLSEEQGRACPRCISTILFAEPEPRAAGPVVTQPAPLRQLGDYELLAEIARGGMGIVYRARQRGLNRQVAVKLMRDSTLARPEDVKRFRAEAASAAKLRHPHIIAIYDVGEEGGQHYFAMDLVEGVNLAERTREGPLPAREAAELVAQIADAVQHAHEQGVLHRDLKPSNVLVDAAGKAFVTDFGLARPLDADSSLTLTGQVLGTPGYMPPEQATGKGAVGPAADLYSLGALLYHLLTGRAPFAAANVGETLRQVIEQEPVSPQLLNAAVPRDLTSVCLKCLAKRPLERYASATALAEDLRRFLRGESTLARPAGQADLFLRWCRRKPMVATLTLSLFAVAAAGLTATSWQSARERSARRAAESSAASALEAAEESLQSALMLGEVLQRLGGNLVPGRDLSGIRNTLKETEMKVAAISSRHPDAAARLYLALGDTWLALGDFRESVASHSEAVKLRRLHDGEQSLSMAHAMSHLGVAQNEVGETKEAVKTLRSALEIQLSQGAAVTTREETGLRLGKALMHDRDFSGAIELFTASTRELRERLGPDHPLLGTANFLLGFALRESYRTKEAETALLEAARIQRAHSGNSDPSLARTLRELGRALTMQGRMAEGGASLAEAVRLHQSILGSEHPEYLDTLWNYTSWMRDQGRLGEARENYRYLVIRKAARLGPGHYSVGLLRASLARVLVTLGQDDEAFDLWMENFAHDHTPPLVLRTLEGLLAPRVMTPIDTFTSGEPPLWQYVTSQPAAGWERPDYLAGELWNRGAAPFGAADVQPATTWSGGTLWLRRAWTTRTETETELAIRVRHDDDIQVWCNGVLVVENELWSNGSYNLHPLPRKHIRFGAGNTNWLAVRVHSADPSCDFDLAVLATPDPLRALRLLDEAMTWRVDADPKDFRWLRARGLVRAASEKWEDAVADYLAAVNSMRAVSNFQETSGRLYTLLGHARLMLAAQLVAVDPARSTEHLAHGMESLARSEAAYNTLLAGDHWEFVAVERRRAFGAAVASRLKNPATPDLAAIRQRIEAAAQRLARASSMQDWQRAELKREATMEIELLDEWLKVPRLTDSAD